MEEIPGKDLTKGLYGGDAAVLPQGITPDMTYAIVGTPRTKYGFLDSFNPTLRTAVVPLKHGRVEPGIGWFDGDYLGIDQGPIVAMIENYRTQFVWKTMRGNPHVVRGLRRAGFTGGWLDSAPE